MLRTKLMIPVVVAVLALSACSDSKTSRTPDTPAVSARVQTLAPASVAAGYEAVGTVRAKSTSVLSSKVVGQVLSIRAQQGDYVKPGQLLVEIDDRDAAAGIQKAKAGLAEAENALVEVEQSIRAAEAAKSAAEAGAALAASTHRRYQALLERKSVSSQEFEEVEFKYKSANAEVRRAEETLRSIAARKRQVENKIEQARADVQTAENFAGYSRVTAPYAGLVTAKHLEAGALSAPGVPILTIEDSRSYLLEANVDESQLSQIKTGNAAQVFIEALGQDPIPATVSEIVPAADPGSRSFVVKLALPRLEGVRSGMFGRARFSTGTKEVLSIPESSIIRKGQLTGVYVVTEQRQARYRLVKTGKRNDDGVEVLSGLNSGEKIVVDNLAKIQDGTPITEL